jgi:trans-2,3-dihydro-3-hydroxyanthranilate isomerase
VITMTRLRYEIVDVFTDQPFAGNPLAVVFGADGLRTGQMQALATEFNYSETVFVLPPSTDAATYRLRIFTPGKELPFAGHPSVGAAVVQLRAGLIKAGDVVQECGAGLLPVTVDERGHATLTGGAPTLGPELAGGPLATSVGLAETDLIGPAPRRAGCGLEFEYVLVGRDALPRATAPGQGDVDVVAWDPSTHSAYSRVFVPEVGVSEDPATGSAALGLGVYLVGVGLLPADGESSYTVHQGYEMGRPSLLSCTVTAAGGAVTRATVTGQVVAIASGEIEVPLRPA